MTTVVIMPGGFHPFHAGHLALYNSAKRAFPDAEVFVAATNDTSERPFPFAVKEKLAKLAGVDPGHFVQVKSPFRANEITDHFDPDKDVMIFVRSEKDADKPPKAGGTKKDGSPAYLQPLLSAKRLEPFARHAYMAYLPTVEFGPGMTSATEIRQTWPGLDDTEKSDLVQNLYPRTQGNDRLTASVVEMLDTAIMGMTEATVVNDPQSGIMIRPDGGLGTYNEPSLVSNLARQLKETVAMLESGNYTGVEYVLYKAGVVQSKVQALARLQQFQDKQGNRPIARGREIDIGEDYVAEKTSQLQSSSAESPQQKQVRAALAKGLAKKSQMARAEYSSQPTKTTFFDPQGRYSDIMIGIDHIRPDGTVVVNVGDEGKEAGEVVKKIATLGGMPGIKVIQLEPGIKGAMLPQSQLDEKCWDTHRQVGMKKKGSRMVPDCVPKESNENLEEKWSEKYKSSINCANPKGFSQRAHCAGRKK